MKQLGQDTLVPLGLAVAVIGSIAAWAAGVNSDIRSHENLIVELRQANEANYKLIYEINARLSRIEWRLEVPKSK